ncbi:DNA-binding protein [Sinorhizobium medicae]|nr:DNA-binding protein [Sinorhizobium medicae]MDX0651717.1 DNA-binding protein [Sinorhizobium medicae]MDX0700881.1 DNA-binding protein [Sinorhizobium medicae]
MSTLSIAPVTMSSREIADLLEARHDSVKRTIERLAERGVIVAPPMVDEHFTDSMGRLRTEQVYRIGKRDSYVIVAQLSPEFTARLVDRWQELEQQATDPARVLNDPAALRGLLLENVEKVIALEAQVSELRPAQEALLRISTADGSLCITEAAKALQMRPKDLFQWLRQNGWIYRRPGAAHDLGYQSKTTAGLLEHKVTTVLRADGSEKVTEQVRITAKGLTKLASLIKPAFGSAA